MANSNELQTLAQVSSEIDESEVKITFANQCIKAQEALANKLKEEIQRRKEICNYKKSENLRLETEIRNAELEVENMRITHKSVRSANTEKKTELLLAKERKNAIADRIKNGEKKYEDLWIQCKKRYENIPLVKKLMQNRKMSEELEQDINILENEAQRIEKAVRVKKDVLAEKDKKQIIQLAELCVHEMPVLLKAIESKTTAIGVLIKEIEEVVKEQEECTKTNVITVDKEITPQAESKDIDENWPLGNTLMIPKLQLPKVEIDITSVKLDINKVALHTAPIKRTVSIAELEKNTNKRSKAEENIKDNYISCYFNKTTTTGDDKDGKKEKTPENYSQRKLINILENIQIDDDETYKLVANANIDQFKEVNVIAADKYVSDSLKSSAPPLESDVIEEIDLTNNNSQDILIPPTQFLDLTQHKTTEVQEQQVDEINEEPYKYKNYSQSKECSKKKVSFELPMETQDISDDNLHSDDIKKVEGETPNDTIISQLDLSAVNDDNFMAIKDMILKKHQLDLSPQFVYAKNTIFQKVDSTQTTGSQIVTSKFFDSTSNKNETEDISSKNETQAKDQDKEKPSKSDNEYIAVDENSVNMDGDDEVLSPKGKDIDKPVTGLLFTHGPQGIPDCLDISMSTTGYEEGDTDFPSCLDSSLLLSPKADLPMPMSGNNSEVTSQDVPNFLSGFRKTGLSFFKQKPAEMNPDSSKDNQENSNFNFNFGTEDKKSRGGLFSFFR